MRRNAKGLLVTMLLVAVLTMSMGIFSVKAPTIPEVVVYVDPAEVLGVPTGDTFDIYVTAGKVTDLFLAEFYLSWDPSLLEADVGNINPGDVAPFLEKIYVEGVDNDAGWLMVVVGRPSGVLTGLSGDVQIAKITFLVEAEGSCDLHLYDIRLFDVVPADIPYTTEDGYFSNLPPVGGFHIFTLLDIIRALTPWIAIALIAAAFTAVSAKTWIRKE